MNSRVSWFIIHLTYAFIWQTPLGCLYAADTAGPCRKGGEDGVDPPSARRGRDEEADLSVGRGSMCARRARSKRGFQRVLCPHLHKQSEGGNWGVVPSGTPVLQMHKMYHGSNLEATRLEISFMRRPSNRNNSRQEPVVNDFQNLISFVFHEASAAVLGHLSQSEYITFLSSGNQPLCHILQIILKKKSLLGKEKRKKIKPCHY